MNGTGRIRSGNQRLAVRYPLTSPSVRIASLSLLSVLALVGANVLDANNLETLAALPLLVTSLVVVMHDKKASLVSALIVSLVLLLISRSVLAPAVLSSTAPLWVSALIAIALLRNFREFRLPKLTIPIALLCLALVLPTALQMGPGTAAKALGIGAMWLLVFLGATNVKGAQRQHLVIAVAIAACLQALLAVLESLLKLDFVRDLVSGSASDQGYVLRDNLILGDWTNRAQGTLGYPIPFAAFLTLGLFTALLSGVVQGRKWMIGIVLLLTTGIVLSGTRSAAVALAAGLAAWCISLLITARDRKTKIPALRGALIATVALGAVGVAFLIRSLLIGDFSLLHRSAIIDTAWGLGELPILRLLFGSGYNSAPKLFDQGYLDTGGLEVIDNALISQVIASGVVGLLLLIVILVSAFKHGDMAARSVLAALVAFFFFFDVMSWHAMTGVLFGAVGFAVASRPDLLRKQIQPTAPSVDAL